MKTFSDYIIEESISDLAVINRTKEFNAKLKDIKSEFLALSTYIGNQTFMKSQHKKIEKALDAMINENNGLIRAGEELAAKDAKK